MGNKHKEQRAGPVAWYLYFVLCTIVLGCPGVFVYDL